MGFFDIDNKWFFNGLFDFNHDGKTSLPEQWLAYKIFEDCTKEKSDEHTTNFGFSNNSYKWRDTYEDEPDINVDPFEYETEDEFIDALEESKNAWRDTCEDGSEFDIDPFDYDSEEEYNEALEEAQISENNEMIISFSVEEDCQPSDDLNGIKETDYPNKRQYNAAITLSQNAFYCDKKYKEKIISRCNFILEQSDTITAARYLTHDGDFLFAQAIRDNFALPINLPDEDEQRECELFDILQKLSKKDISLCLEVWSWCLEQFLDYSEYDSFARSSLTSDIIDEISFFSKKFKKEMIIYMSIHPTFREKVIRKSEKPTGELSGLILKAFKLNLQDTSKLLFEDGVVQAKGNWSIIKQLMDSVVLSSKNYEELETIEFVEQNILPIIKMNSNEKQAKDVESWEKEISEYISVVEKTCDQYAYSRSNAWRKNVPHGEEYGVYAFNYSNESDYLKALDEAKNKWRRKYKNTYGLNPENYETEVAFEKALYLKKEEKWKENIEQKNKEKIDNIDSPLVMEDKTIYTYCGVILPYSSRPYSYRTEDDSIKIGDIVFVPVGEEEKEIKGTVVSVGKYSRVAAPYPVEKTKFIIRKEI